MKENKALQTDGDDYDVVSRDNQALLQKAAFRSLLLEFSAHSTQHRGNMFLRCEHESGLG